MIVDMVFTSSMGVVMLLITVAEAITQISVVISIRTTALPLSHKGAGTAVESRSIPKYNYPIWIARWTLSAASLQRTSHLGLTVGLTETGLGTSMNI